MDALAFTYDPSYDAWVLDLKPTTSNSSTSCSPPTSRSSPAPLPPPLLLGDQQSRGGPTKCWASIRRRPFMFWVCHRPRLVCYGDNGRKKDNTAVATKERRYCSQVSTGDRDEKLREAIVYCKKTMRKEQLGCHQSGCLPRRSYRSSQS